MVNRLPRDVAEHLWDLELALILPKDNDPRILAGSIAVDFHEIGASGRRLDRDDAVRFMQVRFDARPGVIRAELTQVSQQLLADGFALLTYDLVTPERATRRSSLWSQMDEGWVMVFHQGTPVPEGSTLS